MTSESREYVPCAFVPKVTVITHAANAIYEGTTFDFGVASSKHMQIWMNAVGGRLKSDPRFGPAIWNTFALPDVTAAQRERIEAAARKVLDARTPGKSLAELYDPLAMPPVLVKAHKALDREFDTVLGLKDPTDAERLARLFDLYAAATA